MAKGNVQQPTSTGKPVGNTTTATTEQKVSRKPLDRV